jgi:2-keto-4-pentenoate hydratase/2-oxohepta-3-ene-1,7-dioic acid hydratase in catechol pathway
MPYALAEAVVPPVMEAFLAAGDRAMAGARRAIAAVTAAPGAVGPNEERLMHALSDVTLLAPLTHPNSMRDFYAFEEHVKTGFAKRGEEIPPAWYELPVYYKGNARTMIGPDAEILWPRYSQKLDFELELACVIGREGRNIPVGEASRYIAGYMIMNDVSARDIQRKEMAVRLGPAKGKDFATVIGPALVTPEEVGDVRDLPMRVKVNGEVWSSGNAGTSYWTFEQMIAHVSMDETLYPGDILGSGSVGRGCGLELDGWLEPGDLIELEIDRLGVLRNRVGVPLTPPAPALR